MYLEKVTSIAVQDKILRLSGNHVFPCKIGRWIRKW